MLSTLFSIVVAIHGLIHLIGFVKAYKPGKFSRLALTISRPVGILWLAAALLFAAAAGAYLAGKEWWWMIAIPALAVSQSLIVLVWRDAKFGTVVNVVIALEVIAGFGVWNFNSTAQTELHTFRGDGNRSHTRVTNEMITRLPPVVQRWLIRSNVIGKDLIHTVHLTQQGTMRTSLEGSWMPVRAEQWFTTDEPGFFWLADVQAVPGIHLAARDKYEDGKGHMLIKALSLFTVADAQGKEIDQGSMLRYLAETAWFPTAALSAYLQWEQVDSSSARATMTCGGITASGVFTFDANGDLTSFQAQRYYDRKGGATLETWLIRNEPGSCREFQGIRIVTRSSVTWKLKDGDFTWLNLEIAGVSYNSEPPSINGAL